MQLRAAYYHSQTDIEVKYLTPYGGAMTESIGAFPEYILRGTFCKRSSQGLCSPCFYSRFPLIKTNRDEYLEMVRMQVNYVINDLQHTVVDKQFGYLNEQEISAVSLVLTPTGSFFDEFEFPCDIRLDMEQALIDASEANQIDINLYIESHCEDFLNYDIHNTTCQRELELLRRLKTKVILGFESFDEYSRNVLYNKKLDLSDFESTITKIKDNGLTSGAFVFAGLFAYNDLQTHNDVLSTIKYLLDKHIFPVIMFQNVQTYTITDLLLKNDKITLLEPYTVAWIISDIFNLLNGYDDSYWLIADPIGGPPEPDSHIFKYPRLTPKHISDEIYRALVDLRKTRNKKVFLEFFKWIQQQISYTEYKKIIESSPIDIESTQIKTDELLHICNKQIIPYLNVIGGKE